MERRDFLLLKRKKTITPNDSIRSVAIQTGLTPYNGPWTNKEIAHLLKRTQFGVSPTTLNAFKAMTVGQAIQTLLTPTTVNPAPPIKNYDNSSIPTTDQELNVAMGETWVQTITGDGTANSRRVTSFKSWWIGQMLNQDNSILEKMVLFWHNHFSTETADYARGTFAYKYQTLIRQNALGNFKNLVKLMSTELAMLRYLNGYLNTATAPDENYGRELQELFTLGKENNPNYTEDDVKAAAKVLTGWTLNYTSESAIFSASRHDKNDKQFSSFYNNTVIKGWSDANAGETELNDLLTMIFSKNVEVSEHIVRKFYRWFCYYTIDSVTETNVIKPLAKIFRDSNWEVKPVLSALLSSEHFFDELNQGCMIKSPLDMVIGMCREFKVVFPDASDYVNAYNMWNYIRGRASNMQQNLGDPPNVAGWPAYYQVPQFYEIWINSDTLPKRNQFTDLMISPGYTLSGKKIIIDAVAFTKLLPNPGDPNALINDALDILFRVPISDTSKKMIKEQILLTNQTQDYYWSNAWNAYLAAPTDATALNTVNTRLKNLYKYFMNLAEYQLA